MVTLTGDRVGEAIEALVDHFIQNMWGVRILVLDRRSRKHPAVS